MAKRTNLGAMVVGAMVILMGAGFAWADLTDGLVGHWNLDGDTLDSSGYGNDGVLGGDPAWVEGHIGDNALDFDGDGDYVTIPDDDSLNPSSTITIAFWVYNRGGQNAGIYKLAYCPNEPYSPGNSRSYDLGITSVVYLRIHSSVSNSDSIYSGIQAPLNEWCHIAGTFDHGQAAIYINGQKSGSKTLTVTSIMNDAQPLIIGGLWSYCGADHFINGLNGQIDDVRIYDRALSAEEIEQLYQLELPELLGIEIVGPGQIAENFPTPYKAIAHYDDDSTKDVTNSADWSVVPEGIASITAGLLTAEKINLPGDIITLTAQYGEGENTQEAQKQVSVLPICPSGSALQFDGVDDYVEIPDSDNLEGMTELTIGLWVKPDSFSNYDCLIHKGIWGEGFVAHIQGNGGMCWGVSSPVGEGNRICVSETLTIGQWQHLTFWYSGGYKWKIYKNGNLEAEYPCIISTIPTAGIRNIRIGGTFTSTFDGTIDELMIFDRALSDEEIKVLMHTRPDTGDPSLVGYWDFDEGQGQVAADMSGHGNHGQLGSTPDVDNSDPVWVTSDAPVGICTLEGIVERNLSDVMNRKLSILEQLYETIAQEEALLDYMNETFKKRDFGDTDKGDVVKAKQKIHSAIQQEKQAETAVDKSLDKLDDAMNTLGIEPDSQE